MKLKDKVVEARENGKKLQDELLKSQRRCLEIENWNDGNQEMRNNIIKKLQEEKEELDKEVQTLKKDLASLNMFNGNYDADFVELSKELSQAKQELQDCQENLKSLQKENESLKHDMLSATKKLDAMQAEWESEEMKESRRGNSSLMDKLDSIKDQLRMNRENCLGLENEVEIYKEKLDTCNEELEAKKGHIKDFEGGVDVAHKDKATLERQLSETRMNLERSVGNLNDLKAENNHSKERIRELESTICALENTQANKTEGLCKPFKQEMGLSADVTQLQKKIEYLEAELSAVSYKFSESEADLCRNQSQVEELNSQLRQSLNKITKLESQPGSKGNDGKLDCNALLQQAKRQAQEIRFTLQRKEKESKDLEAKLKETREEMHKMEIKTNLGEAQRVALREELETEREKLLKLQEEYSAFQQSISKQKTSEEDYKRALANSDVIIAEHKVMIANMELKYHEISEQHTALLVQHEQYKKEIQEFEDDLLQTQQDMADMQVNLKVAENEKAELNQQMQVANKTIADLQSKLELTEQRMKEKEHEISLTSQRLTKMEEDLKDASKSKSDLEFQLYESNTNARRKDDKDSTMQSQIEELQRTCEGLRQQVAENELVVEKLKDEISSLETDLGTVRTELSYKDFLNATNDEELKRLVLKLKSSEGEIIRLTDLCEKTIQEKGTLEIDLSVANKKIETMESHLKENGEKESNLVKSLQEERNKFVYKETDVASYRSKIAALELQCENHLKENKELHCKVDDLDEKASALKNQLEEVLTSRDQEFRRRMELEENMLEIKQDLDKSGKTGNTTRRGTARFVQQDSQVRGTD